MSLFSENTTKNKTDQIGEDICVHVTERLEENERKVCKQYMFKQQNP